MAKSQSMYSLSERTKQEHKWHTRNIVSRGIILFLPDRAERLFG
jgi:hypothetical protein